LSTVLPAQPWQLLASAAPQPGVQWAGASDHLPAGIYHWLSFGVLVVILLLFDFRVFHRHDRKPTFRESVGLTIFWFAMGLIFNAVVWWWGVWEGLGAAPGVTFLSCYLVEKSLSMDNIFVFVVIFRFFGVPLMYQYRVLFAGILGAIFMRLTFILAGVALIARANWLLWIFGAFLIYTACKLARHGGDEVHPENNVVLKTARRFFRVTRGDHRQHGHRFFSREGGVWCITPMFLVLLVIESTDVLFAFDSVPAVFGVSQDAFIIFTSNIFAILGLRALYFLLAGAVERFRYIHYGLAGVLGLVGLKMIAEYWLEFKVHAWASLLMIAALLAVSIAASLMLNSREDAG